MAEQSKQYTAFTVGMLGFYECEHMPFGLRNAPATFQWLMQNCLRELPTPHVLCTWMTLSYTPVHKRNIWIDSEKCWSSSILMD